MGKTKDPWALNESTFLVVELVQDRGPNPNIAVVLSLPGRDGTFVKRWKTIQGRVDASQVIDMTAFVEQSLINALTTWTGYQTVLPME